MALLEAREAIIEGLGVKLTHGQTTIEVHDLDGDPERPDPGIVIKKEFDDGDND